MLGFIFNNADWAMATDVIVVWFLAISIFVLKVKEWKEYEKEKGPVSGN